MPLLKSCGYSRLKLLSICGLALGLLCAGFSTSTGAAPAVTKSATVPFTYVDNRMMIDCMINGKGSFVMVIDTGSPGIAITPETAKLVAVAVRDAGTVTGAGNNSVRNGEATLRVLSIG